MERKSAKAILSIFFDLILNKKQEYCNLALNKPFDYLEFQLRINKTSLRVAQHSETFRQAQDKPLRSLKT